MSARRLRYFFLTTWASLLVTFWFSRRIFPENQVAHHWRSGMEKRDFLLGRTRENRLPRRGSLSILIFLISQRCRRQWRCSWKQMGGHEPREAYPLNAYSHNQRSRGRDRWFFAFSPGEILLLQLYINVYKKVVNIQMGLYAVTILPTSNYKQNIYNTMAEKSRA